jgi:hypothetical protein
MIGKKCFRFLDGEPEQEGRTGNKEQEEDERRGRHRQRMEGIAVFSSTYL